MVDERIRDLMHERDRMKKKGKDVEYRKLRNKVVSMIRSSKATYYQNIITESKGDNVKLWKCANKLMGKRVKENKITLK